MPKSTQRPGGARRQVSSSKITRARSRPGQLAEADTVEYPSNATIAGPGAFSNSCGFVIANSTIANVQVERDLISLGMEKLFTRTIDGAEYDSSLRDPPPQCHPGTRVQLHEKIYTWFLNIEREKALLWLNGPAGVGKSAVIQTLAESLAKSKCLGASLFFSRVNDRKDPQRVMFTIAYQLATRIPAYRTYIVNQITLDPSILSKGIKEQFRVCLSEPFGNQGIGKKGNPWAILLDGLDECDGVDEQCRIVQLISEFILKFPGAPLTWSISSRPEPHIVATFANKVVTPSFWSEYIPIDSTEACRDVERYLDKSFEAMHERYTYIPPNWPSETQFLKLAKGALGLFVFARTAVRFMDDPNYADPVSRLNVILSVIDHLVVRVPDGHPFALLDALYSQILASIPSTVWHTTKKVLGFIQCARSKSSSDGLSYPLESRSLLAASIIFRLEQNIVYSSLHKLHSVLQIPHQERAHSNNISFLHASFDDYLGDQTRSNFFWIDRGECVDEITQCLYHLYLSKPWDDGWIAYFPQLSKEVGSLFYRQLEGDIRLCLYYAATGILRSTRHGRAWGPFLSMQDRAECLDVLTEIDTVELYQSSEIGFQVLHFLFKLWGQFPDELTSRGLCKQLRLRDIKLNHLDCGRNKPFVFVAFGPGKSPDSPNTLKNFVIKLRSLQQKFPENIVLVCGSTAEKRSTFLWFKLGDDSCDDPRYCIPYPY